MSVSKAQLQEFIDLCLPHSEKQKPRNSASSPFDISTYLEKYGVECMKEKPHGDSTLYVLSRCVFDASHAGGEAAIGQCDDGKLFYQCFHDSCKGKTWHDARRIISGDTSLQYENEKKKPVKKLLSFEKKYNRGVTDSPLPLIKRNEESAPFPFEVLGQTMANACKALKEGIQAPDAIIAQSILGAANLAIQGHANVVIDGRLFPLSLFLLSIAGTGERKSAVDAVALARHREIEKENISGHADDKRQYELKLAAYNNEKDALVKDRKKSVEEKEDELIKLQKNQPVEPLEQTILVTDLTFEGLFKLFQAGVSCKGLFADEGGQVTGGHGMKKESILSTAAGLSKFWDGSRVDRIRATDGSSHLYGRRLSVHMMMQEEVGLSFYTNDILKDQGLISRFLAVWPNSTVGSRMYTNANVQDSQTMLAFYGKVTVALNTPLQYKEDSNNQELDPPLLRLSPEAKEIWVQCYNSIEEQSGKKMPLAPVRGLANKAAEHAARIAATIQLFEQPGSKEIEAVAMQCGVQAIEWYLDEALRIAGAFTSNPRLARANEVLRWIHDNQLDVVALPDIYQYSPVRTATEARKVVEVLIAHNHLLATEDNEQRKPVNTKSGKTSREWWNVHPESNKSGLAE